MAILEASIWQWHLDIQGFSLGKYATVGILPLAVDCIWSWHYTPAYGTDGVFKYTIETVTNGQVAVMHLCQHLQYQVFVHIDFKHFLLNVDFH